MVELLAAPCSHQAAKYAVEKWHYSQSMPASKRVHYGVWENGNFIGCVIFARGANNNIGSPYNLSQTQVTELVRVALTKHSTPVSRIVSIAIKILRTSSPDLKLLVSYADPNEGHNGTIYQAMNWVFEGLSKSTVLYKVKGKFVHQRTASSAMGNISGLETKKLPDKLKYLYPLDKAMRKQIAPLAKPYPKKTE